MKYLIGVIFIEYKYNFIFKKPALLKIQVYLVFRGLTLLRAACKSIRLQLAELL